MITKINIFFHFSYLLLFFYYTLPQSVSKQPIFRTIKDEASGSVKALSLFSKSFSDIKKDLSNGQTLGYSLFGTGINKSDIQAIQNYTNLISQGIPYQEAWNQTMNNRSFAAQQQANACDGNVDALRNLTQTQGQNIVSAKVMQTVYKGLAIAGNMLAGMAIGFALNAVVTGIDNFVHRIEKAKEAAKEALNSIRDSQNKLKEASAAVAENRDRFLELSEGVDQFSNNLSLSESDYAEYLSISQKLAELFPSLISGYDAQGNALLAIGSNADATREKLDQLLEAQQAAANQELIDNMDTLAEGIAANVTETNKHYEKQENENTDKTDRYERIHYNIREAVNKDKGIIWISPGDHAAYGSELQKILKNYEIDFSMKGNQLKITNETEPEKMEEFQANLEKAQKAYDAFLYKEKNALDDTFQQFADIAVPKIDWSGLKPQTDADYQDYVEENILKPLLNIPAEHEKEVQEMLTKLFSFEPGDLNAARYAATIQQYLNQNDIELDLTPVIADEKDAYNTLNQSLVRLSSAGKNTGMILTSQQLSEHQKLYEYTKDFTVEQAQLWETVTKDCKDADSAIAAYETRLKAMEKVNLSNTDFLSDAEKISHGFEQLHQIFADVSNGETFDWSTILNNENFIQTFGSLENASADYKNAYENFIETISKSPDDICACRPAFERLASAYLNHSDLLKNLTRDTQDATNAMLTQNGVLNANLLTETALSLKEAELANSRAELSEMSRALGESIDQSTSALQSQSIAQEIARLNSFDFENATLYEVNALIAEAEQLNVATWALKNFRISKFNAGRESLNLTEETQSILAMAKAIGLTTSATTELNDLMTAYNNATSEDAKRDLAAEIATKNSSLQTQISNFQTPRFDDPGAQKDSLSKIESPDATESKNTYSKLFNWIETRIAYLSDKASSYAKKATDEIYAYRSNIFKKRNLNKAMKYTANAIDTNRESKAYYKKERDKIGLPEDLAKKVREGTIEMSTITDENLAGMIESYQELNDKMKTCDNNIIQLTGDFHSYAEQLANLPLDKAEKKIAGYKSKREVLQAQYDVAIGADAKNKNLNSQLFYVKKERNANRNAQKDADANVSRLWKSKDLKAARETTANKKKSKGEKLSTKGLKEGSDAYNAVIKYNKALKAQSTAAKNAKISDAEYTKTVRESRKKQFDNIAEDYNKRLSPILHQINTIDNQMTEEKAAGRKINRSLYKESRTKNAYQIAELTAEKSSLERAQKKIKYGTDEWYDAADAIAELNEKLSACRVKTCELNNSMNDLYFEEFNDISDGIDRISAEQDFMQSLFAHKEKFDENGAFTEAGLANLGSLSANYYAAQEKQERDATMLEKLQNMKNSGILTDGDLSFNSMEDLDDRIDEFYDKWQNDIQETYEKQTAISDFMKEKYQAELDAVNKLISARKESLSAEKDLHAYQKTINEKTEDISSIKKRIAAFSGDTSQEGLARLQQLQNELNEKQEDLKETEYDKYISDQEEILDKLYEEYEELSTKKMDEFMELVQEGLNTANDNSSQISAYLAQVAEQNGYVMQHLLSPDKTLDASVKKNVADVEKTILKPGITPSGAAPAEAPKSGTENTPSSDDFSSQITAVKSYLNAHLTKAKKDPSAYSDVNQVFYSEYGKKILNKKELKGLAKVLGISYDNASKKGKLYKELKKIHFPGFRQGGTVISTASIGQAVRENGDDAIVSVKRGETILTAEATAALDTLFEKYAAFSDVLAEQDRLIAEMQYHAHAFDPAVTSNIMQYGDINFNFSLPNVTEPSNFVTAIQTDPKVQQAIQLVSVDRICGGSRLGVQNIH